MKYPQIVLPLISALALGSTACGKATATAAGGVTLQAAPLAGSAAASLAQPHGFTFASIADSVGSGLLSLLVGDHAAYAAVSSFTSLKICNNNLVITDVNGNTVAVNGSTNQAGLGILSFSSSSTSATTLASVSIAAGTQIKQINITSAISTTLCSGFSDAVAFDPGSGVSHISQDTAFQFKFATPVTISGSAQTLNLLFGAIVTSMVTAANNNGGVLSNSSIQTAAALGAGQ
jgi:hypothetical protein